MTRSTPPFPLLFTLTFSLFFLFATAQPVATVEPERVGLSSERLDRLTQFLDKEIEAQNIPGAVSLIFRKGEVAHFATHGYHNAAEEVPMPEDAIFYIQSMTKPIISVAIMMLYEEGYFSLKDPVSKYLPQFESPQVAVFHEEGSNGSSEMELVEAREPITIVQLLTHTAGMLHGLGGTELDRKYVQQLYMQPHQTIAGRVEALAGLPLVDQPGASWHYSAAPDVLSLLIEHFSGMSTAEFLQLRIFDPLGMKDTGYDIAPEKNDRVATLHQYDQAKDELTVSPRQATKQGNTVYSGTHGLFSTPVDYLHFCRMLLNGGAFNGRQLLSPKTVELMTADHVKNRYPEPGYGFGLGFAIRTDLADGQRLGSVGQYGWSGAYNTYFFIDPEEEMIGILMMQMAPYTNFYNYRFQQLVYQAVVE